MKQATIALLLTLTLTQTLFAQGLSPKCTDEFLAVPEKKANFEMQGFLKVCLALACALK